MIAWGIVVLSVFMVYGTVMWVRPSAKERRLADLRLQALKAGVKVQQGHIDDLSVNGRVNKLSRHVYFYRRLKNHPTRPLVTLLRTTGESGIYLPDGWTWERSNRLNASLNALMLPILAAQPPSVFALEMSPGYVGIAWDERDIEQLPTILIDLDRLLSLDTTC